MPPSTPSSKPHIVVKGHLLAPSSLVSSREQRRRNASALERRRVRRLRALHLPLRILMLLAVAATLMLASSLLIPLVLAVFIALGLNPIVTGLHQVYVPRALGSLLVLFALCSVIAVGVSALSTPATHWLRQAPTIGNEIGYKLKRITQPVADASHAAAKSLADIGGGADSSTQKTATSEFSLGSLLQTAPRALAATMTVVLLALFFLTYGDRMRSRLVTAYPGFSYRRIAVHLIRNIQIEVSRYLLTVTVINVCLGALTAAVLWALKMPNPLLWGGVATLLNYVPYMGAITTTLLLVVIGLLHFNSPLQALAPAACFVVLASMEGSVVTPMIMGHRLQLSPVAVLVWLLLWGWMWGLPGVLLATPMLVCLKLITERLPGWEWFAQVVGR